MGRDDHQVFTNFPSQTPACIALLCFLVLYKCLNPFLTWDQVGCTGVLGQSWLVFSGRGFLFPRQGWASVKTSFTSPTVNRMHSLSHSSHPYFLCAAPWVHGSLAGPREPIVTFPRVLLLPFLSMPYFYMQVSFLSLSISYRSY